MILSHLTTQQQLVLFTIFTISAGQIVFEDTDERSNRPPNADCLTPENEMGRCVRWTACQTLRRIADWNRLQPYVCGFGGSEPRVCCALEIDDRGDFIPTIAAPRKPPALRTTTSSWRTTATTPRPTPTSSRKPFVDSGSKPQFLPDNCGGQSLYVRPNVVRRQFAGKGDWPWMAVVFVEKENGTRSPDCGGALLTDRHVVTAAHCVVTGRGSTTLNPNQLSVRLGAHDLRQSNEPDAVDIPVESVRRHEQFDPRTYKNDIAVLRLRRPVHFSKYISPVCLPYDSLRNEDLSGKTSTVTGFGTSVDGASNDVLIQGSFDITEQELCRRAYEKQLNITDVYLCAGTADGSKDSCLVMVSFCGDRVILEARS